MFGQGIVGDGKRELRQAVGFDARHDGNIDFVGGAKEKVLGRARDVLMFVDSPSAQSLEPLANANVSWVFIDRRLTQQTTWEPWARVDFENDEAIVLRVNARSVGS